VVCFFFVTLRVRSGGIYFEQLYCVAVYGSIFILFSPFFRSDVPFRNARQFLFPSLGGATNSEKWRSKIAKILKIDGKVFAHHFV